MMVFSPFHLAVGLMLLQTSNAWTHLYRTPLQEVRIPLKEGLEKRSLPSLHKPFTSLVESWQSTTSFEGFMTNFTFGNTSVICVIDTLGGLTLAFQNCGVGDPDPAACHAYDPSKSVSAILIDDATLSYETPCCSFNGSLYADTIGGIPNVSMLVAQDISVNLPGTDAFLPYAAIIGLGLEQPNPNTSFINSMVESGLIETAAFSIWLSGEADDPGEIIFGGVDPSFIGGSLDMRVFPAQPLPKTTDRNSLLVPWYSLEMRNTSGSYTFSQLVQTNDLPAAAAISPMLDWLIVDNDIFDFFVEKTNANITTLDVDCTWLNSTELVVFTFGNGSKYDMAIEVPLSALIRIDTDINGTTLEPPTCWLSMANTSAGGFPWLGTPFLRSAYVAWDLDAMEVGIAQSRVIGPQELALHSYNVTYLDAVTSFVSSMTQAAPTGTFSIATLGVASTSSTSAGSPKATNGANSVLRSLPFVVLVETSIIVVLLL